MDHPAARPARIAWADHAKGLCIILVVMLYAADHVAAEVGSAGWLEAVVEFARPFRMPDFFLVSGVLLTLSIHRDWRTFLDRKVAHFAYFYVLWLSILVAFASPWLAQKMGWDGVWAFYLRSYYHPYSLLWFIYLLPIFFVLTKALRGVPIALVWTAAAVLQTFAPETGVKVLDKFSAYFVFFYSGYAFAPHIIRFANAATARPMTALAALAAWALVDGLLVYLGLSHAPGVSLALAFVGAAAIVAMSALMTHASALFSPLAYCGRNTLPIYLAFAIPLAFAAKAIFMSGLVSDPGTIAALVTAGAVCGALVMRLLVKDTPLRFLFERPARLTWRPRGSPEIARRLDASRTY